MILFFIPIIITVIILIPQIRFFKKERHKCQAYRFYSLRDEMIKADISKEINLNTGDHKKLYHFLNEVVHKVEHLNMKFLYDIVEEAVKIILNNNDPIADLTPYEEKLASEVLNIIYENSIFLRFTSKFKILRVLAILPPVIKGVLSHNRYAQISRNATKLENAVSFA